jgi:type VI protein secretion system component Hcp
VGRGPDRYQFFRRRREGREARFQELHVVSRVSKATPLLLDRVSKGTHIQQADLAFVRSSKDQSEFLHLDLDDVLFGSH